MSDNNDKRIRRDRYAFTIENYTENDVECVKRLQEDPLVKVLIVGEEVGKETGVHHLQGFIALNNRTDFNKVLKMLGGRANMREADAPTVDNIIYCGKENKIIASKALDNYSFVHQDKKIKMDDTYYSRMMDYAKHTPIEVFETRNPKFYWLHNTIVEKARAKQVYRDIDDFPGDLKMKNFWIWGETRVGKSRVARSGLTKMQYYSKPYGKWWLNYSYDECKRIIIDDWPALKHGEDDLSQQLKCWSDAYKYEVEVKGGNFPVSPWCQVIVTSNYPIDRCIRNDEDVSAISARFTVIHMKDGMYDEVAKILKASLLKIESMK